MEREGVVSLWVGLDKSDADLQQYVTLVYTDEGEWLPSRFLEGFKIEMDDIDEHFIERVFYKEKMKTLSELIGGCSYEDIVIPNFESMTGNLLPPDINSAILVYNFEYNGDVQEVVGNGYKFKFIGSVQYE